MANTPLGDDVYGEDLTVNKLENVAAEMFGKEISRWFWDLDHHENLPWKISAETLRTGLRGL